MKQGNWEECIESHSSLKISPDKAKANSLIQTALGQTKFFNNTTQKEDNVNYIFEGHYSSLLEMVHAIVLVDGYKLSNHICLGFYLRDKLNKEDYFRVFNDCRIKRNSLV